MVAADLDAVAADRPVVVTHASGHIMNVNTLALQRAGLSRDTDLDGLVRDAGGGAHGRVARPRGHGHHPAHGHARHALAPWSIWTR